jgi:glycosyltransferase involved in cell wall biosynthesis
LLFKVDTIRNQGAFKEIIFTEKFNTISVKEKFNIPLEKRILLSFSRLDRKKRINVIIESLLYLPENYFLVIAGTGECEESLKELVQKHNLQNRILFLGFVEESNANSIKASADIFVSVDIGDFDISPLEAMALGCKAVVSTEFDLDDNLSKFHNLKSSIAEPKALANVINELYICDPDTHYQEKLKGYTWESYFHKILKASNI